MTEPEPEPDAAAPGGEAAEGEAAATEPEPESESEGAAEAPPMAENPVSVTAMGDVNHPTGAQAQVYMCGPAPNAPPSHPRPRARSLRRTRPGDQQAARAPTCCGNAAFLFPC